MEAGPVRARAALGGAPRVPVPGTPLAPRVIHAAVVLGDSIVFSGGRSSHITGAIGNYATDQDLATVGGGMFFAGGVAMLDIARGRWMPIQHFTCNVFMQNDDDDGDGVNDVDVQARVREHRTGHVMVPAKHGLLVIGGLVGVQRGVVERCAARRAVLRMINWAGTYYRC